MRLLVLAAVRNYQSRAPFPMAMRPNVTRVFLLQTTIRARHSRSSVSARSRSARRLNQTEIRPKNSASIRRIRPMVAVRQLTVLCTAAFVLVVKCPEVRLQSCLPEPSSSFITPETNCSYRLLIVTVQFQSSRSFVLNVLPESYLRSDQGRAQTNRSE